MKILYIFAGKRKNKFKGIINVDYPDTQMYGYNHMKNIGVDAKYLDIDDAPLGKIFSFNIKHALMFFRTRGFDVVFGSALLPMMFFKKIFRSKSKFILLNISFSRLYRSNKNKKMILWLAKELDGIVCLSSAQKEYIEQNISELSDKTFSVHLGVDTQFYSSRIKDSKPINNILSVGRDNGRDYRTVIDVAGRLPDKSFEIVCSERNLKNEDNLPDNINVNFDISSKELREKYKHADLLLLTTHDLNKHTDGADCSGQTVLLDAMASGLPSIVTYNLCLDDYIESKSGVTSVDPYDTSSIIESIKNLEENHKNMAQISQKIRTIAENRFSTFRMANDLMKIFNTIK